MFCDMNPGLLYSYNTYKNEISNFLLDNNRSGIITVEIDVLTKVYPEEAEKIGVLLSTIELLIETGKSEIGEHSILCRHNSAEEVFIVIQDIYQALKIIIPSIYSVLLGAFILDEKWKAQKKYKLDQEKASELKKIEIERAHIELEREKIALEKEKAEFLQMQMKMEHVTKNLRRNIVNYNIDILEINHISYGNIPPNADKEIIQFSSKK